MARFCTKCGAVLNEDFKFCVACGTPCKPVPQPIPQPKPKSVPKPDPAPIHPRQWTPEAETARLEAALREAEAALAEQEAVSSPQAEVKQAAQKQPERKTGTAVLSVLLCIFMAIAMLGAVMAVDIRGLTDQDRLYSLLSRIDLSKIPAEDVVGPAASAGDSVDAYICDAVNASVNRELYVWEDLSPSTIRMLLEDTTLLDLISEKAAEFLADIAGGRSNASVDAGDVESFLYQNRQALGKAFRLVNFDQEGCRALAEMAQYNVDFSVISVAYIKAEMPGVYDGIRVATSVLMLIGLAVIALLLVVLVMVLNRRSVLSGIRDCAITAGVVNGLVLLATGVSYLLPMILAGRNGIGYVVTIILSEFLLSGIWVSVAVLGVSVIALAVCVIIRKSRRKTR